MQRRSIIATQEPRRKNRQFSFTTENRDSSKHDVDKCVYCCSRLNLRREIKTQMNEGTEIAFVAFCAGCGAVAAYVTQSPIPDSWKVPIVTVLGAIAAFGGAYWAAKVNRQNQNKTQWGRKQKMPICPYCHRPITETHVTYFGKFASPPQIRCVDKAGETLFTNVKELERPCQTKQTNGLKKNWRLNGTVAAANAKIVIGA